jgi:hypothetical protein
MAVNLSSDGGSRPRRFTPPLEVCSLQTRKASGLVLLLASLLPSALAAEVYVPHVTNRTIGNIAYNTKVWVTNTGTVDRRFTASFVETGINGSAIPGTGAGVTLTPGRSTVLTNVAPAEKIGMLEVASPGPLVVNARLEVFSREGLMVSATNLPVVSTANAYKPGTTAYLQGLQKSTQNGDLTDFGLVNLSRETAQCTVRGVRADGTQSGTASVLTLVPLSHKFVADALASFGESSVADARLEVTCDKQFFPYAVLYRVNEASTVVIGPSSSLEGTLVAGGPTQPTGGTIVVTRPGTFLAARQGASALSVQIPVVAGLRYKKATVEFDLGVGRFPTGIFTGVYALRRNDRTLFHGLLVRNDRTKTILDLGVDDDLVQGRNGGPWKQNNTFHVFLEYDTVARTLVFKLSKAGVVLETLSGRINHTDLMAPAGKKLTMDFGQTGIADGAYFPPIGWTYSNLTATLVP